jgi:hypothetical protein
MSLGAGNPVPVILISRSPPSPIVSTTWLTCFLQCGMLIESSRIRGLLNVSTVEEIPERGYSDDEEQGQRGEPATYSFSLNPIPALVILLLGTMMGSHHQSSMISTMVHKQWGNLLVGASFARGLTYVLIFLRPPTSVMPSRPPTELLASFGLIAGGIIFMASVSIREFQDFATQWTDGVPL